VGQRFDIPTTYVASYQHYSTQSKGNWIYVDPDREAADLYIVNHVRSGDLVVTQDMGLAGLLTQKEISVLTPRGKKINEENIMGLLDQRYLSKKWREKGHHTKGPKAMTSEDKARFKKALLEWVRSVSHGDECSEN
jgi:hypothetical protein